MDLDNSRSILSAAWRHRWLVLLITAAGTAAGVSTARLIRPLYRAETTLWYECRQGPGQPATLPREVWADLVTSNLVLEDVVADNPEYFEPADRSDAAERLRERIEIQSFHSDCLLRLKLAGSNASRTGAVLDAVAEGAVQVAMDLKREKHAQRIRVLEEQMDEALQRRRELDAQVKDLPKPNPAIGSYFRLKIAEDELRRVHEALEGAEAGSPDARRDAAFMSDDVLSVLAHLETLMDAASAQLERIPVQRLDAARERQAVERDYAELSLQYEDAIAAAETLKQDLRVLDAAVVLSMPIKSSWAQVLTVVAFLLGSLAIAVAEAAFLDRMDRLTAFLRSSSAD